MNLAEPLVLFVALLAIPVLLFAWRSQAPLPKAQLRLLGVLQALAVVAAAIALAGPWSDSGRGPVHRVVVWAGPRVATSLPEIEALREQAPRRDPFVVVRAGAAPHFGLPGSAALPEADGTPDLAAALRAAAASIPAGAASQIVLFTSGAHDGEPLAAAANELTARGIPVDVRTIPGAAPSAAMRLLDVQHAPRVGVGEAFRIAATVQSTATGPARLEVRDGEELVGSADLAVRIGEQLHHVDAVVRRTGAVGLEVRLVRDGAVEPATGRERSAVIVDSGLRVLHLAAEASRRDALAASLRNHGIRTLAADPAAPLDPATLAGVGAVLVDDLPATAWPREAQQALRDLLLAQGTGLVLAGTHQNLGPGGYAASPLMDVLPVRMPQREERRDPSVSLVLIVDTSGSMGGGRLELAKEVARLAIQKLQPHDKVGLIEFHGSKRWAAPLQPATNTIEITRALNRLQVGGGTIIYEALEESYFALLNAQTRFQHILVLTDGGVESGPFEALARRMAQAGQTVSSVLIGPQANSPFLLNLAQWGRGRFYSCPDKFQLPDLQFREPQSSLLPAVQERRVPLQRTGDAEATAAFSGDDLPPSGGIVEASVRDGAEVLLRGAAGEPYLVGWDQGAGRVLVLAGQAIGPQSGELHDDPAYAAFLADLLRSAAGGAAALLPQLQLATQERGVRIALRVPVGAHLPAVPVAALVGGPAARLVDTGDCWEAFLPWSGDGVAIVEVRSGDAVLATGAACPPAPRHLRRPDASNDLATLATVTGGGRSPLAAPWPAAARQGAPQAVSHAPAFTIAALVLFVATLLLRRLPLDRLLPRRGAAAAVALLLGMAVVPAQEPASVPLPPADEAAVRAAIDAELRATGDLAALAARWQGAPALHRHWLARAEGDLATAAELCKDPSLASSHRDVRVQMLDALGRPGEALAALGEPAADLPPAERGAWLLRHAVLHIANGDRASAAADLQAAVAAAAQPAFTQQAAVVAAAFQFFDLALQWQQVGAEPGREACQAALRRGLWQQRAGRLDAAGTEYELAFQRAAMQRDRAFALAMLVAVRRTAGTLPALADGWLLRAGGQGPALHPQEFEALGEVLRELGRAREGLQALAKLPAVRRAELGDLALTLAVEAGEPETAISQLQRDLAADPGDAAARCSLAVLLADQQRTAEAELVLRQGLAGARIRDLRRLCAAASELGMDGVVAAAAAGIDSAASEEQGAIEGLLLEVAHLRRQGKDPQAIERLLAARAAARRPQDRLRLAEQLESLGRQKDAIELYSQIWEESGTEDTGMRLAWLLGESKVEADRQRAQAIFRKVWTQAGSAARRVQAEEHVLDIAAREGTLADLAIELEAQLADPAAPNRPAVRDALIKIYTRARDTTGAVTILRQWIAQEPAREVEALQQLARVHLSAEEFRNHERALQRLLQVDPEGELDYRQQLAMSALERGRPEDARQHLRGLLGKPGTPDTIALEFAAGIYTLAALHEESVRLYRRALALHPERVETFLLLGNALRAAGRRDAAIGTFQELLLRPLPDDLFVVAVDGLLNMEAPRHVLAAAARAVRLRLAARPEQVFLHRVLQDLLEAESDEPGRLLALEDTVTAAGEQRANFVRELMQEAEARRDWREYTVHGRTLLLLGDEVPPAVYLSLGEALLHTGDVDAAARSFARARLGADFTAIETRTAELYENAGRLAEAERLRVRLLRRKPEEPTALLAVARLAERQGAVGRALPNWLAAATRLLPAELDKGKPAARRPGLVAANRSEDDVAFAEPFAGVLRCATGPEQFPQLLAAIRAAATEGAPERRLAAQRLWRHLAVAYPEAGIGAELRAAEDSLLQTASADLRAEIRTRRVLAGDLAAAQQVLAGPEPTAAELRVLLLTGAPEVLAAAAAKAKPALLPDLARSLLLAGREAEAKALLPLAEQNKDGAAARDELRALFGMPAVADAEQAQRRLEQALSRSGPLAAKVNAVCTALRELPKLPAGERRAHLQGLATAVVAAKDSAAAERLLANARTDLDREVAAQIVELAFANIERVYQVQSRAEHLDVVPTARAVELVRTALRKFRDEERRTQLLQMLGNPDIPEAVLLELVADCEPRGLHGTDRLVFTNGLERARSSPKVLAALAAKFVAALPEDPVTLLLRAKSAGSAAAERAVAVEVLPQLFHRTQGDRDETIVAQLVRAIGPDDAKAMLARLPAEAPYAVRIPLLQKAGDKQGAADAFLAAHEQKPDDSGLLYRAANFFEAEGMYDRAARLYRTAQKNSPTFYPYQAQQLARLELQAGNPMGAMAALRASKDPTQLNFRLVLRVLAEVSDPVLRQAALADAVQQRAARGASGSMPFAVTRFFGGASAVGDRLAAVLQPVRMPCVAPKDLHEAEEAPSDYDLLAFLPEGEAVGRTLLRTLDDAARAGDLGIYRGMLGAAKRAGRAQPWIDEAARTLAKEPFDAEAMRVLFAAAQVGLEVPPQLLHHVLHQVAVGPRPSAATLGSLISLGAAGADPTLAARVLRTLVQQRAWLADYELRPWLPGLCALACQQMPEEVLNLVGDATLDSDAAAELGAVVVLHHPDPAAAAKVVGRPWTEEEQRQAARDGSDLLPRLGALLMQGDADGAVALLHLPGTYWMPPRLLGALRLAAAVPPIGRWQRPEVAARFGEGLLGLLPEADEDRLAALARVGAVLAARMAEAGQVDAARELRDRLRTAAAAAGWRQADWLPD